MSRIRQYRFVFSACLQTIALILLVAGLVGPIPTINEVAAAPQAVGSAIKAVGELLVVRRDGIQERLTGDGALPIFEGDVLSTNAASQALIQFKTGPQVAMYEHTTVSILSRWEKAKGTTQILRLKEGTLWVTAKEGGKTLEVETPVAIATIPSDDSSMTVAESAEFNLLVTDKGQSTLTVLQGGVEFETDFGICSIPQSSVSQVVRGQRCTNPVPANLTPAFDWRDVVQRRAP